ncbi:hypothetical protein [Mongoliimonas terrestris]|nr:hypothetical protein [Mongoliimonas terrestris]
MADGAGLKVLAYLLEMAREEAASAGAGQTRVEAVPRQPDGDMTPRTR